MDGEQEKISECKSCGAEIRWLKTKAGKNIPVDLPDPEDLKRDEILAADLYEKATMTCHFETCPNADQHRKPRESSAPASSDPSVNAKRLNTALVALEDIIKSTPDGLRAQEIAKAAVSQIRAMR